MENEFLPSEILNEVLREHWEMCKRLEATTQDTIPKIIAHAADGGNALICLADFPNEAEQKRDIMRHIGLQLGLDEEAQYIAFFFLSEAWTSTVRADAQHAVMEENGWRPSQDPKRQETLVFTAISLDEKTAFRMANIIRREGEAREFADIEDNSQDFGEQGAAAFQFQMGSHMLPELVKAYAMTVIARKEPALRAKVEEIISQSAVSMVDPGELSGL